MNTSTQTNFSQPTVNFQSPLAPRDMQESGQPSVSPEPRGEGYEQGQSEKLGLMDRAQLAMFRAAEHVREHRLAYSAANLVMGCVAMATGHPAMAVCAVPVQQGLMEM